MKLKYFYISLLLSMLAHKSNAQDLNRIPNEPTYFFNPLAINPAYAGSKDVVSMSGILRKQQLFGQNGGSGAQYFSIDLPIADDKFGIGFQAYNNPTSNSDIGFISSVAYRTFVGEDGVIAVGAQGGLYQVRGLSFNSTNQFKGSAGAGVYYRDYNKYIGLGIPNILALKSESLTTTATAVEVALPRPIYLSAGYVHEINDDIAVKGGLVVRSFLGNAASQLATAIDFNSGSDVNATKAFIITAEVQLNEKLRFSYGFDLSGSSGQNTQTTNPLTGAVTSSGNGQHYLMLRYEWDSGNGRIENFRYF
jgi:type IX secretion system PorP/SprF family membrane protein